ncbi:hypothetical protein GCM10027294_22140 [Marinactinospora endophytica]
MIDAFRAAFQELIDAALAGAPHRFGPAVRNVHGLASQVPTEERAIALEALAPIFSGHHAGPGVSADLAVVAGALVEMGTDPGPTAVEILRRAADSGKGAALFLQSWEKTGGGTPPEPEQVTSADEERVAAALGENAPAATMCWWTSRRYGLSAKTMLGEAAVRAAVREDTVLREDLTAVAAHLAAFLPEFDEVGALARMSEAASALVLDRASGRGFRVRFDGIGDNFQLHTLLADALIGAEGRGLAGERPAPSWVAAASGGEIRPEEIVTGWWNLTAADGSWIWNEGVPADIPEADGERVIVLDEPPYRRTWNSVRRHPHVQGWLEVVEEIGAEEAAAWWQRIPPGASMHEAFAAEPTAPAAEADTPVVEPRPDVEAARQDREDEATPPETAPAPEAAPREQAPAAPEVAPEAVRPGTAPVPPTQEMPAMQPAPAGAEGAEGREGHDEERRVPGAGFLPPLPPGVSDSAAWSPRHL